MNQSDQASPVPASDVPKAKALPVWPVVSIVILVMLGAIFPPSFLSAMNMYLLGLALIVWAASGERFDRNLFRAVAPFGLIILIGMGMGVGADWYLYLKDGWYISNPAVILTVGYVLYRCKPDLGRGLRAFVIGGTLVAIYRMSVFVSHPDLLLLNASAIREAVGTGNYAPALAFSILCAYFGHWSTGLKMPRWLAFTCLVICSMAVIVSFSRTIYFVAVIGLLAATGSFARREWLRIGLVATIGLATIATLQLYVDVDSNLGQKSFVGKIARSIDEITISDYSDLRSINLNWRGFETSRAWNTYLSGSPLELVFGQGFGTQVDLGLFIALGAGEERERVRMRLIPILHNGYAYLLVKGGLVAVGLYLYVLGWLYLVGRRGASAKANRDTMASSRILQAAVAALAFSTWVISGAFNKGDMFSFMLAAGFLLAGLTRHQEIQAR